MSETTVMLMKKAYIQPFPQDSSQVFCSPRGTKIKKFSKLKYLHQKFLALGRMTKLDMSKI